MLRSGAEGVRDIIRLAEEVSPRLRPLTVAEFLALDLPPRRMILDPWLPEKGLAMIYSPSSLSDLAGLGRIFALIRPFFLTGWHAFAQFPHD